MLCSVIAQKGAILGKNNSKYLILLRVFIHQKNKEALNASLFGT